MTKDFFTAIQESNIFSANSALTWFKSVLRDEVLAYNFETGVSITETGASARHFIMVVTEKTLITWGISQLDADDENNTEGVAALETVTQIFPLSNVQGVLCRQTQSETGELQKVEVNILLSTQDAILTHDEHQQSVFYDTISLSKTLGLSSQEEFEEGLHFANTLAAIYAARR